MCQADPVCIGKLKSLSEVKIARVKTNGPWFELRLRKYVLYVFRAFSDSAFMHKHEHLRKKKKRFYAREWQVPYLGCSRKKHITF